MTGHSSLIRCGYIYAAGCLLSAASSAQMFSEVDQASIAYTTADRLPARNCASLAVLDLPEVLGISADMISAADGNVAYCRVHGTIAPEITFQVDLPLVWNGRMYMNGNGAHAGQQPDAPGTANLRNQVLGAHFVLVATDTGHDAAREPGASFVMSNPQKAIDYAYRAVHVTAVTAREVIRAYYDEPVDYAYWNSCSNGGRQGLLEAQRYPEDFDGIIANAPWVDQTGFSIGGIWNQQALDDVPLTTGKLELLADHVMRKCDAVDGLTDGLIDDPRQCPLNVAADVPACAAGMDDDSCLTPAQAQAIQMVYDGPVDSTGRQLHPGFMPGSEALVTAANGAVSSPWLGLIVPRGPDDRPADFNLADNTMRYLALQPPQPDWNYRTFDFDRDPEVFDRWSRLADASDINLRAFRARGGKLLMTYGWADQVLQPLMGVEYYEQAVTANGENGTDFMRLFMVPGMTHCAGGVGPDQVDTMTAIIDWVEAGEAPELIVANKRVAGEVTRSRPLCPYPQVARYTGQGSMDAAENFVCRIPQ